MHGRLRKTRARDPQIGQNHQCLPRPDPREGRVVIAWIVNPDHAARAQIGAQRVAAFLQQRAQPERPMVAVRFRHRRQPLEAGPPRQPQQERFRLIVARMAQCHPRQPLRARPLGQQAKPGLARGILQVAATIPALPAQGGMGQAKRVGGARNKLCLGAAGRAQAVIDTGHSQRHIPRAGPVAGQMQQRHAVAAARHGQTQSTLGRDPGHGCAKACGGIGHGQLRRAFAASAP